jgi:type IV pilus assembly protein PilA
VQYLVTENLAWAKKMVEKNHQGFSLIELMTVIVIISVLALVAVPGYRNFIAKAEFVETKMAVGPVKVSVELCVQTMGLANAKTCVNNSNGIPNDVPAAADTVGLALTGTAPGKQEDTVEDDDFVITATAPTNSQNEDATYTLTGTLDANGRIQWNDGECSRGELC